MKNVFMVCLLAVNSVLMMAQSYPERVYLTGSATPVGWSTSALPMYSNGDGTYEYVGMLYNGEFGNEFKILGAADWLPSYGPKVGGTAIEAGKDYELEVRENDGMDDKKFTVPNEGRYHLTLSLVDTTLYVAAATAEEADKNGIVQALEAIYIVGNGTGAGWEAEKAFAATKVSDGVFTITTTIYGHNSEEVYNEFKFLSTQSFDMPHIGPSADGEEFIGAGTYTATVFTAGDKKWHNTTTETKDYIITVDLNNGTMVATEATPTGVVNVDADVNVNAKKVLRNGQLYILNNEEVFTATGARIK